MDGLKPNGDMDGGSAYGFEFMFSLPGGMNVLTYECICMSRRFIYIIYCETVSMSRRIHISYLNARRKVYVCQQFSSWCVLAEFASWMYEFEVYARDVCGGMLDVMNIYIYRECA